MIKASQLNLNFCMTFQEMTFIYEHKFKTSTINNNRNHCFSWKRSENTVSVLGLALRQHFDVRSEITFSFHQNVVLHSFAIPFVDTTF